MGNDETTEQTPKHDPRVTMTIVFDFEDVQAMRKRLGAGEFDNASVYVREACKAFEERLRGLSVGA